MEEAEVSTATATHEDISALAHALWEERGCPEGSPEVDWLEAEAKLAAGQQLAAHA